jgi:hypothetical protein
MITTHPLKRIEAAVSALLGNHDVVDATAGQLHVILKEAAVAAFMTGADDEDARIVRTTLRDFTAEIAQPDTTNAGLLRIEPLPSSWTRDTRWPKFYRQDGACVYEANGSWSAYLMSPSGIADSVIDEADRDIDAPEDETRGGLLEFATAQKAMAYVDRGYPITINTARSTRIAA